MTFEACYRLHYERVFRWSLRIGAGNVGFAEDVSQDVFLVLHRRLPHLDRSEDIGGWLYRVTVSMALRRLKNERSFLTRLKETFAPAQETSAPSPHQLYEWSEESVTVMKLLERLPAQERVVVVMKVLDGKRQQEIAEALSLSKGYVSKLVDRAGKRLAEMGWRLDDDEA